MTSKVNEQTGEILEYPVRSAFQNFYLDYAASHHVSGVQQKAASCIMLCKTGKLGYSVSECPDCDYKKIHARSCNNRNCPNCQAPMEKKWVMERNSELIPGMSYYHVVFTLPHELNSLIFENQERLYKLLFSSATDALITLCRDKKFMGALPAIVSVLHTWGQKLNFHPHLHVMLSGGGLTPAGQLVQAKRKGFIIPKQVLSKVFRGKFMEKLKYYRKNNLLSFTGKASELQDSDRWQRLIDRLYKKEWLPFLKETFNGNGNAVAYLAKYAYRTAISNSRILDVGPDNVTISYKDYTDNNAQKKMELPGTEFIRLFLQHVLPPGFHRVRFSGLLCNCRKSHNLTLIGKLIHTPYTGSPTKGLKMSELISLLYGEGSCTCPFCHKKLRRLVYMHPPESFLRASVGTLC